MVHQTQNQPSPMTVSVPTPKSHRKPVGRAEDERRGMVNGSSRCVLQACETLQEKIKCCPIGKRELYEVLTPGGAKKTELK